MDVTDDRGYPFPQCDPPYIKDPADLPAQLKALAEAVDDDVTALAATVADALNPPAALISSTIAQSPAPDAGFDFTTTVFTTPGVADLVNNGLRATSSGLYVITGACTSTVSNNGLAHSMSILVNGAAIRRAVIRNGTAPGEPIANGVDQYIALNVGDFVTMTQSNSVSITYQFVRLGMCRVVEF